MTPLTSNVQPIGPKPATHTEAEARAAQSMRERAAAMCDARGDAEYEDRIKKHEGGIALLGREYHRRCAAAIRALPLFEG